MVLADALTVQLFPDMEADRLLPQAKFAIEAQDFERAKTTMVRILELPEQFRFRYTQVLERLGLYGDAIKAAMRYLTLVGRDGVFYREALGLLKDTAVAKVAVIKAAEAARVAAEAEARLAAAAATRQPVDVWEFDGMEFVWVPAGEFLMGLTSSDA